jgi:hypothetical protein
MKRLTKKIRAAKSIGVRTSVAEASAEMEAIGSMIYLGFK